MKKTLLFLSLVFLLHLIFSCEKIEIPNIATDNETEIKQSPKEEKRDSTGQSYGFGWSYNCTIDLSSGDITDSAKTNVPVDSYGDGTKNKPYNIIDIVEGDVYSFLSFGYASLDNVWICGYIVGYIQGNSISKAVFSTGNVSTNLILSDSPFETEYSNCVPVQLPTNTKAKIRENLNLRDNPSVLGKKVRIYGSVTKYMSTFGLKSPKYYELE